MQHLPVLVAEAVEWLAPERGGLFVDATVGLGGHAETLLAATAGVPGVPGVRLLGIDRDPQALARAARRLAPYGERVAFEEARFDELETVLARRGSGPVAGILADLGVSSLQLETAERGFSFRLEGPLDMRMGPSGRTAAELVNESSEEQLAKILWEYGEEQQARRIARAIVRAREEEPLATTGDLKRVVDRAKGREGRREGRIDPATRVFQALRIAVNEELAGLETFLDQAVHQLESDGRLVVISYHSLEDRIVKNTLRDMARGEVDEVTGRPRAESQLIEVLTRKPVTPSAAEVDFNPRSRSAKLRAARRL